LLLCERRLREESGKAMCGGWKGLATKQSTACLSNRAGSRKRKQITGHEEAAAKKPKKKTRRVISPAGKGDKENQYVEEGIGADVEVVKE
jgi:hypothetical protein